MIKVAYGSIPKEGGTYSFFLNHRDILKSFGIELYCVTVGYQSNLLVNKNFHSEGCIYLAKNEFRLEKQAIKFVEWAKRENIQVVIPVNSEPMNASVTLLPKNVKIISRVANSFKLGYQIATEYDNYIHRYVILNSKSEFDLLNLGIQKNKITKIPNGFDLSQINFKETGNSGKDDDLFCHSNAIQIGFVGRLEHNQKGVFHLKPILEELDKLGVKYKLDIVGTGKDKNKLEQELGHHIEKNLVSLVGGLNRSELLKYYQKFDVLLFPSHFEGMSNVLIESLCSGNYLISWNLKGITDEIIDDHSGKVFEMADYIGIANELSQLNLQELREGSINRRMKNQTRFSHLVSAESYAGLIKELLKNDEPQNDRNVNDFKFKRPSYSSSDLKSLMFALKRYYFDRA
jgi:glycosyltransferase involved in cell wall biosynthesis